MLDFDVSDSGSELDPLFTILFTFFCRFSCCSTADLNSCIDIGLLCISDRACYMVNRFFLFCSNWAMWLLPNVRSDSCELYYLRRFGFMVDLKCGLLGELYPTYSSMFLMKSATCCCTFSFLYFEIPSK